jgi:hypothetical protein
MKICCHLHNILKKFLFLTFLTVGGDGGKYFSPVLNAYSDRQNPSLLTQKFSDMVVGAKNFRNQVSKSKWEKPKTYYCQPLLKQLKIYQM